jgi:hypothetical protein
MVGFICVWIVYVLISIFGIFYGDFIASGCLFSILLLISMMCMRYLIAL